MNLGGTALMGLMMAPLRPPPQCPVCHKHQTLNKTVPKRFKATMIFHVIRGAALFEHQGR